MLMVSILQKTQTGLESKTKPFVAYTKCILLAITKRLEEKGWKKRVFQA
jgi:hypothetical protein